MANTENSEDACVICLEDITEKAIADPCLHGHFDFLCLMSWLLEEGPQCPLCIAIDNLTERYEADVVVGRASVNQVRYAFESPTVFKTYHTISRTAHTHGKSSARTLPLPRRRRPRPIPREEPELDPSLPRRRHIYRHKLYSLHIGASPKTGFRNVTARAISSSPDLQSKATKWIRRELSIFEFLNNRLKNKEYLLKYIITILKYEDIKGSNGVAEDLVQEFLGRENARLFLHELESWLRSPYKNLWEWDAAVQYRDAPSLEELPESSVQEEGRDPNNSRATSREGPVKLLPHGLQNSYSRSRASDTTEDQERHGRSQYPFLFEHS